ncbi:MBL fold metallo-hydrolase [Brevibacillus dissolubilis]|uniref:MBL fold metallo-hydrolase n=1 Tax=Brevibacillus dissolubilis TaxID=1844116 RepID=UPI003F65D2C6
MHTGYDLYQIKVASANIRNFNYIVVDQATGQTAIVDPAWDLELITGTFRALGVKPDVILLTHSHDDHVNMAAPLVELYGSQVYMSAKEIDTYQFRCPNLNPVEDLDAIQLGETGITCLVTPGHTVGGTCYLLSESLFTGDTIFIEGCGICTTVGGSPYEMFESIQRVKRTVEPHVRVYPGHSFGKEPGQPLSYLLRNNIYFHIERIEHFIKFRMRGNQKGLFDFK